MGFDAVLERQSGTQLANLVSRLGAGDCLVVFNFWWQPKEIASAVRLAADNGVIICVITDRRSSAIAELASHLVIVPSEGVSLFPSLTPAASVVHAVLAEIARLGGRATRAAVERTELAWARMDLFDESR